MKKPIRPNITVKASSIHDNTNTYDYASTHERTTTPPRIFRPLFQTKDSPSLGRRSSELMSRFLSKSMSRPIGITVIVFLAILFNAIIGTISGIGNNNAFATTSTLSIAVNDIVSLNLGNTSNGVLVGSTSTTDTTISVNTTNATGYTLKIAASSGTSGTPAPLSNVDTGCTANCIIPSITTSTSTSDASSLTTNTWGYYPSKFNGATNTVYRPAPTIEGDTLDITSTANASSNNSDNNNYNIAIGAKVDYVSIAPGTYSSAFIVTAIANATPYTITYNANGGANAPANESSSSYADIVNISSTMPVKTGYTFLGWCSGTSSVSNITTTAGVDSCGGITYNPNGAGTDLSWNIDQTSNTNDLYLYAMWGLNSYTVTVNFAGIGVGSVTFENSTYGNAASVTTSGGTTSLKYGVPYTIAMEPTSNSYTLDTWATTANGTLGSTTDNPTTYTVTGVTTLTVTGKKIYMQDLTLANCPTGGMTVYDKRDEKSYTVKKINGRCWMTQNLRYLGDTGSAAKTMTIGNNNSNVANKSITLYSLNSSNAGSFNAYSGHCDSTNSYNYACVYDSGNTSTGVWYNFYAASAGTISTDSNSTTATSDICPAGWHVPSGPNTTANTDYNKLVGNTTSGSQAATSGLTAFSAVAAGDYINGSLLSTGSGYWWSATADDTASRYSLSYNSSKGQFSGNYGSRRFRGSFVRCVRSS